MRRGNIVLKADITKSQVHRRIRKKVIQKRLYYLKSGDNRRHKFKAFKTFILENCDTLWEYEGLKGALIKERELLKQISPAT